MKKFNLNQIGVSSLLLLLAIAFVVAPAGGQAPAQTAIPSNKKVILEKNTSDLLHPGKPRLEVIPVHCPT